MGPQFIHIETYSVKPNKAGNSVDQVIKEALRDAEFSVHVIEPQPPNLVHGVSLDQLRQKHADMLENNATTVKTKKGIRDRKIRDDRDTLFTVVMSYPVAVDDLKKDPDEMRRYEKWRDLNVQFLSEQYGAQLKTVIEHEDEEYPHLHAYVLPEEERGCFAQNLHPGHAAKARVGAELKKGGSDGKAVTKAANSAYRAAMRDFQDEYFAAVGAPSGLTRTGPKRERKTRKEWQEEKERLRLYADTLETVETDKLALHNDRKALDQKTAETDDREVKLTKQAVKIHQAQTATSTKSEKLAVREADLHKRESDYNERYGDLLVREMNVEMSESEIASKKKELSRVALFADRALERLSEWLDVEPGKSIGAQLKKLSAAIRAAVAPDKPEDLSDDDYGPDF
ncbi:hypothetical protein [Sulfitobacter dubius]|nr:hypothetical protein [Sulfitobacter dubius]